MKNRDKGAFAGASAGFSFSLLNWGGVGIAGLGTAIGLPIVIPAVAVGCAVGYGIGSCMDAYNSKSKK